MEAAIERLFAVAFTVVGASHIAAPQMWARFMINLRDEHGAGSLKVALLHGPFGMLIVAFHPVYSGPMALVTLVGAALAAKGLVYFVWPGAAKCLLANLSEERTGRFRVVGVLAMISGLIVGAAAF